MSEKWKFVLVIYERTDEANVMPRRRETLLEYFQNNILLVFVYIKIFTEIPQKNQQFTTALFWLLLFSHCHPLPTKALRLGCCLVSSLSTANVVMLPPSWHECHWVFGKKPQRFIMLHNNTATKTIANVCSASGRVCAERKRWAWLAGGWNWMSQTALCGNL